MPEHRKSKTRYGASICAPCAEFMLSTIAVVKAAVESSSYDKYANWVEFSPPSARERQRRRDLLKNRSSQQQNKFAVLDSGASSSHQGMRHDLEPESTFGFGRYADCTLYDLPQTDGIGRLPDGCYVCHLLKPLRHPGFEGEIEYCVLCDHAYLVKTMSPRGSPFAGAVNFPNNGKPVTLDLLPLKGHSTSRASKITADCSRVH